METAKNIALIIGNVGIVLTLFYGLKKYKQSLAIARANKFFEMWRYIKEDEAFVRIFRMLEANSPELAQLPFAEKLFFLGFYEKIAILVNSGLMKKHVAHYMFSYYAIRCWESDYFWADIKRDGQYWQLFCNFAEQMQAIEAKANFCLKNYKL